MGKKLPRRSTTGCGAACRFFLTASCFLWRNSSSCHFLCQQLLHVVRLPGPIAASLPTVSAHRSSGGLGAQSCHVPGDFGASSARWTWPRASGRCAVPSRPLGGRGAAPASGEHPPADVGGEPSSVCLEQAGRQGGAVLGRKSWAIPHTLLLPPSVRTSEDSNYKPETICLGCWTVRSRVGSAFLLMQRLAGEAGAPAGVSSGGKGVFSPACMYVQVFELKPHADASHSKLMMLCSPRSRGGCFKRGEVSWQDPVAGPALFAQFLKQPE